MVRSSGRAAARSVQAWTQARPSMPSAQQTADVRERAPGRTPQRALRSVHGRLHAGQPHVPAPWTRHRAGTQRTSPQV